MKVFIDKFRFFEHIPLKSSPDPYNADFIFTECGKIVDYYIRMIYNPPKYFYCFTDAVSVGIPPVPDLKIIVPHERYASLFRIHDIIKPVIKPGKPEPLRKLFLFIVDNYYFDLYALSKLRRNYFTFSNKVEEFGKHLFCIYSNMSVNSEDYLLYEAMANGCVPITHKNVPGIHFKTTGRRFTIKVNTSVYVLEEPDTMSFEEALKIAKGITREEYEDLQAKVKETIKDVNYEERTATFIDFVKLYNL